MIGEKNFKRVSNTDAIRVNEHIDMNSPFMAVAGLTSSGTFDGPDAKL